MRTVLLTLLLISFCIACQPQQKDGASKQQTKEVAVTDSTPTLTRATPTPFEWVGYTILENEQGKAIVEGDLNGDGTFDRAFLAAKGPATAEEAESVHLIVLLHDKKDGVLQSYVSNDLGLPLLSYAGPESLALKKNVLSYFHQQMRNEVEVKYRYESDHEDMVLIGLEAQFYGNATDGPSHHSINYLTGEKISERTKWTREGENLEDLPKEYLEVPVKTRRLSALSMESIYEDL